MEKINKIESVDNEKNISLIKDYQNKESFLSSNNMIKPYELLKDNNDSIKNNRKLY